MTPDDIAVLQYTGGTTGVSKGAELRHRNLTANIRQLISWFSPAERTESFLAALPLFHVFGMTVSQNICLAVGGCMVLVPDPRNMPMLALRCIRKKTTDRGHSRSRCSSESCLSTVMRRTFAATKFCYLRRGRASLRAPQEIQRKTGQPDYRGVRTL